MARPFTYREGGRLVSRHRPRQWTEAGSSRR